MIEIRIHGRGGQGNVVAAYLIATAAIDEGRFGQTFSAFGAERRGAPFVRISSEPILLRCQVRPPSFLIVHDETLRQTFRMRQLLDTLLRRGRAEDAGSSGRREPLCV